MRPLLTAGALWAVMAGRAQAHATEQGFVLLLPTDAYIAAGGATVALTVLLLALLPGRVAWRRFARCRSGARRRGAVAGAVFWRCRFWRG